MSFERENTERQHQQFLTQSKALDEQDAQEASKLLLDGHKVEMTIQPGKIVIKSNGSIQVSQGEMQIAATSKSVVKLEEEFQQQLALLEKRNIERMAKESQEHSLAIQRLHEANERELQQIYAMAEANEQRLVQETQRRSEAQRAEHQQEYNVWEKQEEETVAKLRKDLETQQRNHKAAIQREADQFTKVSEEMREGQERNMRDAQAQIDSANQSVASVSAWRNQQVEELRRIAARY